jgi:clorobiocin biosynthesis protein CloN6
MYPIGFFSIKQRLHEQGFNAEIVNLASLMLMHPQLDVERLLARLDAPVFGFDLHWMAQCHGSIELATKLKAIHPEALIIFGGISATYYADELIQYPAVDVVVKGYDTLEPVTQLMQTVKRGDYAFDHIPNLLWKRKGAGPVSTGFTHKPMRNYNDATVDWSYYQKAQGYSTTSKLIMTLPNTGCAMDCPWLTELLWGSIKPSFRKIISVSLTNCERWARQPRPPPSMLCSVILRQKPACINTSMGSKKWDIGASFSNNFI